MIACASPTAAENARCERSSATFHGSVLPLLGAHPVPGAESGAGRGVPQAFLVQQEAGWELATHYHTEHQFQLVSAGDGFLGQHSLAPLMVHYASPESGYGPIRAGNRGLDYYTLRARGTQETWYLPESRARMRSGLAKRHAYGGPVSPSNASDMAARYRREVETLMTGADGLGVWMLRLPAGELVDREGQEWGGVRFYYVAAGAVDWSGHALGPGDVASANSDADCFAARAQAGGAELLVMQFPGDCLAQAATARS